jgi:CHAD domain-containing protein
MPYQLRRDDRIRKAIPRLARKQSDKALAALADAARPHERVHEARTAVKKLRALLRLVKPRLGGTYHRENARLRRLGKALSELRDAEVMISTFEGLFDRFEEQLGPPLRRVRTRLDTRLRGVESRIDLAARLRDADRGFRKTRRRARHWAPCKGGWDAIAGGLSATYRWGRRAMAAAYDEGDDAAFHDWRKAVKYHGYHMQLLAGIWPVEMDGRRQAVDRLAELLGEDHDLAVFATTLRHEQRCFDSANDQQVLLGLIAERQKALRAMARPLGRRVYAERPADFTAQMHRHWKVWRREQDQVTATPQQPPSEAPAAAAS